MDDAGPEQGGEHIRLPTGGRNTLSGEHVLDVAVSCLRVAFVSGTTVLMSGLIVAAIGFVVLLFVLRSVNPPGSMLMLAHKLEGRPITQQWVPLNRISPNLVKAVIMSEDGQFCRHNGIDFKELAAAMGRAERGEDVRGASTISMQVAKNMFLWPERSYVRKALEMGLTVVMELVWPKPRILEVYLNVAEWGPGIFGAEAAARYHFNKPAARLTEREAALLAAALPSPIERPAGRPRLQHLRLAAIVERRMRTFGQRGICLQGL
jgi:monofunctional biosynthetic peptidoglycan transglycosylase